MQKQPVLVVGAGFWGKRWIETVRAHPALELSGVVARTEATLKDVRRRYGLAKDLCFTDLPLALRAREAGIVAIVSPAQAHLEHIRAALRAGAQVICEKPLADNWKAALEIAKIVRAHPRQQFMVAQTRRFTGQVETLRRTIETGRIGKLDSIMFDHRVNYTGGGYRQRMEFPVLEDMICHHLDALRYITGQEPRKVFAEAWNPPWSQFDGRASNILWTEMTQGIRLS
ncbi:MAG: Gfo/Idh/MocA family oxidoreductase, partial [Lentisphaerae bacterium]|nr:Gfo/Idh/MocA family oxidoreductase [Lentisphaerota bacterium]